MRPLRVALVHRPGASTVDRTYGPWSYPVPEFVVRHFPIDAKYHQRQTLADYKDFDVVVHEDGKCYLDWDHSDGGPPLVYVVTDSTLSPAHYNVRHDQSRQADLVLVDWDDPTRFAGARGPAVRVPYCVNDRLFYDRGLPRTVDVAFVANIRGVPGREALHEQLAALCRDRGWTYVAGQRIGEAYALAFATSRVVIHVERNAQTRAHRCFDAPAAGACLVTDTDPRLLAPDLCPYLHYWPLVGEGPLVQTLSLLLSTAQWQDVGLCGQAEVLRRHTWGVRATELYRLFVETFRLEV